MDTLTAIHQRRSIRDFTDAALDRATLKKLVLAAVQAPSAMNLQPWLFAIVHGADQLEAHGRQAREHMLSVLPADSPLAELREHLENPQFSLFYGAPALVVICARGQATAVTRPEEDCCLAAQNLMLAAVELGLGTCWVGMARPWLGLPATRAKLGIPQDCSVVAPIVVGVPRTVTPTHGRKDPEIIWS